MRQTRARFKLALRWCRDHEEELRARALGESMATGNMHDFWNKIRSFNRRNTNNIPGRIEDAVGTRSILALWKRNFEEILNTLHDDNTRKDVTDRLNNCNGVGIRITVEMIKKAVEKLSVKKAFGYDGLPGGVYIHAPNILFVLLCFLFNNFIRHKFIPDLFLRVLIVPLLKSSTKDPTLKSSYRPIAIANIASKILELIVLDLIRDLLATSEYQFGFKPNLGTEICVYSLKSTIDYYFTRNTPVFICFLDAKAAFDRVNYWKLFKKLLNRHVPPEVMNLLVYWFTAQQFMIKWGSEYSESFKTTNGIRQGSILSPYLFNVYVDELNIRLAQSKIGCKLADKSFNNLSYADDLVVLSPSAIGLQMLLDICEEFAVEHDIVFNTTKTVCMMITPSNLKIYGNISIRLQDTPLNFVDHFCYLGHTISNNMTSNMDIDEQRRKLCSRGNVMLRKFHSCQIDTKIELFRSYCSSIYCSSLWYNYTQERMRRLRVCHNDILRRIFNVPRHSSASQLFVSSNLKSIDVLRRNCIYSLKQRIQSSNHTLLIALRESDAYTSFRLNREWDRMLYP